MRHFATAPCYKARQTDKREALSSHILPTDGAVLSDAAELIARFGEYAGSEAALRADKSRNLGNLVHFLRWRQIERTIGLLNGEDADSTIH
jgi:hypothetical protein